MTEDLDDDFMQFLIDQLNHGYSEYKRNHPDFAKVVEEQLEGKTEREFERQFIKKRRSTCEGCGEWLEGYDMCSACGRINRWIGEEEP
jgi:hypothetical protein